ncbi:MAG: amidohydrolase, partial [Bacteroidetes bacterium]|nr:amidohydrolase [Bacteroidota bacterium]
MLLDKIRKLSQQYAPEVIGWRRHLHSNPELSYKEFNTAKLVAERLKNFGLNPVEGVAGTGVVVVIEGKSPRKK